jgi:hypothetical protein
MTAMELLQLLVGLEVYKIEFDFQITLQFDIHAAVAIVTPATLRIDGSTVTIDPAEIDPNAAAFIALRMREVTSASADDDGTLHMSFGADAELTVPSDPRYESWLMWHDDNGARIVCEPGGRLTIWSPLTN